MSSPSSKPRSLSSKITLILGLVLGAYAMIAFAAQRTLLVGEFDELQDAAARKDLERVRGTLLEAQNALADRARDWAASPAVSATLRREGEAGLARALGERLGERELGVFYVTTSSGEVLYSRVEDPATGAPISLPDLPSGSISPASPLVARPSKGERVAGLLMTDRGALLVGASPIVDAAGTTRGGVVLGRFLVGDLLEELGELAVDFELWPLDASSVPDASPALVDRVTTSTAPVRELTEAGELHLYSTLVDLRRRSPSILLRARLDPGILRAGKRSSDYTLLSTLATGLLILVVLSRLLSRIVIGPVAKLADLATRIGQTDDTSVRTSLDRDDELGQLSAEFDSMLEKLELSRQEVIRASRLAGMSEIATGVLHNVGNVLNSVNVSTNLVLRQTENLPLNDLAAMRDILLENKADLVAFVRDDPRGEHLVTFVEQLTRSLETRRAELVHELSDLQKRVDHISELVRSQRSFAGRQGVLEPTDVARHVDHALQICRQSGSLHDDLEVQRDYAEIPELDLDRHKLTEVVVNLAKNALDAMAARKLAKGESHVLGLTTSYADGRLRIEVCDTGCGIAPEDLTSVFSHGFTTKDTGHGYGLHVSANAATEMGGKLTATSDGPGHGACFTLEMPAEVARRARTEVAA